MCARLLAEPEYFSPPDEVCCWLGRRGEAADQPGRCSEEPSGSCCWPGRWDGAVAGLGAAAKSHREDAADRRCGRAADRLGRSGKVAGRGAVAKRQAGNAAVAKRLLAGGAAAE